MMSRPLVMLLGGVLLLTACASPATHDQAVATTDPATTAPATTDPADGITIVATSTILGDLVTTLVDGAAQVDVLFPPGADPHDFALSAAQAEAMRSADLVVVNGGDLEEQLHDTIEQAEEDGVAVFHALEAVETIEFGAHDDEGHEDEHAHEDEHDEDEHEEHEDGEHAHDEHEEGHEDGHDHDHGGPDPHFWHDPQRVADVVEALADTIAAIDESLEDEQWAARSASMVADLDDLDDEVRDLLAAIPEANRILITNHDALGYFADAYGFTIAGSVIPSGSTLASPSVGDLEDLVAVITETGVPAIFAETIENSRLAEVVALEAGRDVQVLDLHTGSLSDDDGPAATYADFMRSNAATMVTGLAG